MKLLKNISLVICVGFFLCSCGSSPINKVRTPKEEPVVIANDSLEYKIIIIDPGFTLYLATTAQPEGFYSQNYLEARNSAWVVSWNQRAQNPINFNPNIYENSIDYQPTINYGYEVNYKLFNYFLFAQRKYKMSLGGGFRSGRIN
ncbi:hypothetical protein CW731_00615 [Polaribacter sp. ALD11]|uniref:DUF6146 family protein n=1 Tax=Polaribacter sp. ALD11 TaxID=2058137 RepID=UPI000C3104ED|nr:DUF6146 family protein [Polaribacter sp. ALD11]AUC83879.1 hypothetical protein CW731_00615 [Polaribacter sp. ALD11]